MTARILAVDDDPGMRRVLERTLDRYDVELAAGIAEAHERMRSSHYDVALVDVQLGDGDGYTLCREIRREMPRTDVILITGSLSEPDEKLYRSLEEGAFYFLFKPFERRVLRALVERCLELQNARQTIERLANDLSEDLERARKFQRSLIPAAPAEHGGWRVEGRFRPCDALGGDLYFYLDIGDDLIVSLGDIVGHGVSAAMYAGMLRSILDAARRRDPEPEAVQKDLATGIELFESESYASLFYAAFGGDGTVRYFNAGHPPPLCLRASGDVEPLKTTSLILTPLLDRSSSEVDELALQAGERLLLFSDGMYEVLNEDDDEWGVDGLASALKETAAVGIADALDAIQERMLAHAAGRPLDDDATMVLVERLS